MEKDRRLIISSENCVGLIGAATIGTALMNYGLDRNQIMFITTKPDHIDKVIVGDYIKEIYVVDIPINVKNARLVTAFVRKRRNMISLWADHHIGTEFLTSFLGTKLLNDPEALSCMWLLRSAGYEVPQEWFDAADWLENPQTFKSNSLGIRFDKALKQAMIDKIGGDVFATTKVRGSIIEELTSKIISQTVNWYAGRLY